MKNLKRALSALVVSSLMLSSFVPAFGASQYTYETQASTLYDLGLFKGVSEDSYVPALGDNMDRQQGIIMMLRLVGKIDDANAMSDAEASQVLSAYTDANQLESWAVKGVAYAIKNNLVIGTSATTLEPTSTFIGKMYATIILRNIGYSVDANNYDAASGKMVEVGGLTPSEAIKFDVKELIRDDFAGMAYGSLKAKYAVSQKTVIETLVEQSKVNEAKAIAAGLVTPKVVAIKEVNAVGAKKLEVKFAAAVDPSKAAITVKKETVNVNIASKTFAADNKSVVIELSSKLTEGNYTVSVAGLTANALAATTAVQDEKVSKIEFTSDKAVLDRDGSGTSVTVPYKVYNQYTENVTTSVDEGDFFFSSSKGTATPVDGVLTIDEATFEEGDKFTVTALHGDTSTFTSTVVTVVESAQVADISIIELYNEDEETLDITKDYSEFKLILEAKDQYGNEIDGDLIRVGDEVIVSSSDEDVIEVGAITTEKINDEDTTVLNLVAPATKEAGTAKIRIISTSTGHSASFDVVVKDAAKVDTISYQTPEIAVAGETFEVEFTAVDQFGNEVTDADDYNMDTFVPKFSDDRVTATFSQDYVKGTPKLTVNAKALTEAKRVVMTFMTPTNNLTTLTLNIKAPAKAVVVASTDDFNNKLLVGDSAELTLDNVIVKDQYDRNMDIDTADYKVVVATSNSAKVALENLKDDATVVKSTYELSADVDTVKFSALEKGTSTITLKLQNADGTAIAGSEYTFTTTVVEKADISSYELGNMGKIYDGGAYYGEEVEVYGKLADGSKVLVPYTPENYTIFVSATGLSNEDGTIVADGFNFDGKTDVEKQATIIVTVKGQSKTQVLSKNLTVTNVAPVATTITLESGDSVTVEGDNVVSLAASEYTTNLALVQDVMTVKDQYGKEMVLTEGTATEDKEVNVNIIATNTPDEFKAGETFNLTIVTDNAQYKTIKVILE